MPTNHKWEINIIFKRSGGGKSINIRTGHIYSEDCTQSTLEKTRQRKSQKYEHMLYASVNTIQVRMGRKEKKKKKKNIEDNAKIWRV